MSIVAFASGNASPATNYTQAFDPLIELKNTALPVAAETQLYGAAVDSLNPGGPFSFAWAIYSQGPAAFAQLGPAGAGGTGNTSAEQNPVITASTITEWSNIRLFLVVTNTATQVSSESDPLKAPSSAFCQVRINSAAAEIQKPAAGERDWHDDVWVWADKIEATAAAPALGVVIDHSDVSAATGPDLDSLVSNSYPDDPNGGAGYNPLHIHKGADVDNANFLGGTTGVAYLEEAPKAVGSPKIITQERVSFTAFTNTSNAEPPPEDDANPLELAIVDLILPHSGGANVSQCHLYFWIEEELELVSWKAVLNDGGGAAGPAYKLELMEGNSGNVEANTMTEVGTANVTTMIQGSTSASHFPLTLGRGGISETLAEDTFLGVQVRNAPDDPGHSLTVTINCRRHV